MKSVRFDLEQQILNCWSVCDDLEVLCEGVLERDMKVDDVATVLSGMKALYQLKFQKCFETFEKLCEEGNKVSLDLPEVKFPDMD